MKSYEEFINAGCVATVEKFSLLMAQFDEATFLSTIGTMCDEYGKYHPDFDTSTALFKLSVISTLMPNMEEGDE